jgi:beta-glucosidase
MDIEGLLKELTLEEKASLCMGADSWSTVAIERLGIPPIRTSDGPHGLRKQPTDRDGNVGINESVHATCFPPAALASCSFDRALVRDMGAAIGDEAVLQDIDVVLGPAINIKRSPLCGRNFEYVSEDPYLAAEYAIAFIDGVQSRGVGTSLKHFAANSQESLRMNIDAVVDERALREIYLFAFERAVRRSKPYTVMASYNRINGEYGCENSHTLKELLRGEWGFDGLVMSDWAAISDRLKALAAGCDLEMPNSGPERSAAIVRAVKSGAINEATLDEAVRNILRLVERCSEARKTKKEGLYDAHHALAKKIALESMVLLKNEAGALPLDRKKRYALIGAFAEFPRYQGGGSSHITPTRLSTIKGGFEERGVDFSYAPGYDVNSQKVDEALVRAAARAAAAADVAVVCIGLTDLSESEGRDRKDMSMPSAHERLIRAVCAANGNVIVVLCSGSAVDMGWERPCRAVLYAGVMGQAGGEAVCDILFGDANPSGRLSETFPMKLEDTPCFSNFPGGNNSVHYSESIYVGYRYYATAHIPVRYPFGYGLSYASFEYSGLAADTGSVEEGGSLLLTLDVKNTGKVDGATVVQAYVRNDCNNTYNPLSVLKGYEKVYLKAGETRGVEIKLDYEDFFRYAPKDGWVADTGEYEVFVGENSADTRESLRVRVSGRGRRDPAERLEAYRKPSAGAFDAASFARLYGELNGRAPSDLVVAYKPITIDTPLRYCRRTLTGRILAYVGKKVITKNNTGADAEAARQAMIASLGDSPIRNLVIMNAGTNLKTGEGLVDMMNGRPFRGLMKVLKSIG